MKDERLIIQINRHKENPRLNGESWNYYENWLQEKAIKTQAQYLRHFIGFLEWMDTDTDGLYKLYLEMISDTDTRKRKKMGMLVVDYQKYLMKTKGIKGLTSQGVYIAVKGFFDANELPFKDYGRLTHDIVETPNISLKQIDTVLNATGSFKLKAYIKVARDSGLRTSDIANLPIRVVRSILDDPNIEYFTFECKQKKTRRIANPVLGPDSLDALRAWINYRVKKLNISAEDGDPLFCVEKTRKTYTTRLNKEVSEIVRGDWMDESNMGANFYHLVRKADIKPLPGNTRRPTFHSLRVFHKTTLEHAGVPTSWINKMQGRAGEGTGGTYTKPSPEQLIEMYKKGYPALSGREEDQHEKIDMLTHELGLSQYEMAELREERDKYRAGYELRTRLQNIIDNARLEGWPEEIIKKLEENLESVETFEDGVLKYRAARAQLLMTADMSYAHEPVLNLTE